MKTMHAILVGLLALSTAHESLAAIDSAPKSLPPLPEVELEWGLRIPLRDGVTLNATVYRTAGQPVAPCIFTLTPYIAQSYHDRGMYFAQHG